MSSRTRLRPAPRGRLVAASCVTLLGLASLASSASGLPAGFLLEFVMGGFDGTAAMAFAPDGRTFICERTGNLLVIKNGQLLDQPFLTVPTLSTGEWGLPSVAFDPAVDTTYTATFIQSGFTDDPIVPGVTTIRVVHIVQLRARPNALLTSAAVWTDDPIIVGTTVIKAIHFLELQGALDQAHTERGATHAPYTALGVGGQILAAHIAELRLFLAALE